MVYCDREQKQNLKRMAEPMTYKKQLQNDLAGIFGISPNELAGEEVFRMCEEADKYGEVCICWQHVEKYIKVEETF